MTDSRARPSPSRRRPARTNRPPAEPAAGSRPEPSPSEPSPASSRESVTPSSPLDLWAALRFTAPAFLVSKAVTLAVAYLTLWQSNGRPTWATFRAPFDAWDGTQYMLISRAGYPGDLNLAPGALGYLWSRAPGL